MQPFCQAEIAVRLEWGPRGARIAAQRGDVLVVVDVLRFSSAVAAAVDNGVRLFPVLPFEAAIVAARENAEIAVHSLDVPAKGRYSLSPATYQDAESGTRVVIASANGATCAHHAGVLPFLFAAGITNSRAVGRAVNEVVRATGLAVTVLACGERWSEPSEEGDVRFAVEDYLGAGALLSHLQLTLSPEAEVCRAAFEASRQNLRAVLWECESGRELREKGLAADVDDCSALDIFDCVPALQDGGFRDYRGLDMSD